MKEFKKDDFKPLGEKCSVCDKPILPDETGLVDFKTGTYSHGHCFFESSKIRVAHMKAIITQHCKTHEAQLNKACGELGAHNVNNSVYFFNGKKQADYFIPETFIGGDVTPEEYAKQMPKKHEAWFSEIWVHGECLFRNFRALTGDEVDDIELPCVESLLSNVLMYGIGAAHTDLSEQSELSRNN